MAARDKYDIDFKCEQCGETGVIGISEDDYPFMKKSHRAVDYTKGKFSAQMKDGIEVSAVCGKCKHETIYFNKAF